MTGGTGETLDPVPGIQVDAAATQPLLSQSPAALSTYKMLFVCLFVFTTDALKAMLHYQSKSIVYTKVLAVV